MKQIWIVFLYTFKEGIRKKSFWVSTFIIMGVLVLLCLAPRLLSALDKGKEDSAGAQSSEETVKEGTCYLIDESGIFEKYLEDFEALYPERNFHVAEVSELEQLKKDVAQYEQISVIYIEKTDTVPSIHVINTNFMKGISSETVSKLCNTIWQTEVLSARGVDKAVIEASQIPLVCTVESAGEMDITGYALGLILTFVMFFAVYYYGYGVAMSVASEKTSRVMETLIISAEPSKILVGKCLAMGAVGLIQIIGLLSFGGVCYAFLVPKDFQIAGLSLTLENVNAVTVLLLLLYFLLGYAFYAVINSVCGAAVSKIEDLNSAMMPVSILSIIGFYLGYLSSAMGGGSNLVSKIAMYLPISSPFSMPFKLLTEELKVPEILISVGILVISIVIVAILSSRIYNASVMHYGNRLKWKDLRKIKAEKK